MKLPIIYDFYIFHKGWILSFRNKFNKFVILLTIIYLQVCSFRPKHLQSGFYLLYPALQILDCEPNFQMYKTPSLVPLSSQNTPLPNCMRQCNQRFREKNRSEYQSQELYWKDL